METVTRNFTVYPYSELSDSAKQKAREWYVSDLDTGWDDYPIDDAKEIASLMGWSIDRVHWSGFWSQGDGACFTGIMRYAKGCSAAVRSYAPTDKTLHQIAADWQKLQRDNFYSLRAVVKHRGHYSHERCAEFDVEDTRHNYGWVRSDDVEKETARIARDFMRWIYRQLEESYNAETADDAIAENCDANNWRFLSNGKFFGGAE